MRKSEHGIPLICQSNNNVLTVENYIKWYSIYIVEYENVFVLPDSYYEEYVGLFPDRVAFSEHIPTPEFCLWLRDIKGFEWDSVSLEAIIGRWVVNREYRYKRFM